MFRRHIRKETQRSKIPNRKVIELQDKNLLISVLIELNFKGEFERSLFFLPLLNLISERSFERLPIFRRFLRGSRPVCIKKN